MATGKIAPSTSLYEAAYTTTGLTVPSGTIAWGGYCLIGKLCIVNIRINNVTASSGSYLLQGLPAPNLSGVPSGSGVGGIAFGRSTQAASFDNAGGVIANSSFSNESAIMSVAYIVR